MTSEWRVVNFGAPRFKYSPFKCFGENETAARYFMDNGSFQYSFDATFRLESRPLGGSRYDWAEVPHVIKRPEQQQESA